MHNFASLIGRNPSTVYTWLRTHAGYRTGRKKRADAGTTALPKETLHFIAAAKREGIRGNGKATLPTAVAMNIAHTNGIDVTVSEGRVNALLRAARMDAKAQAAARNHITLRSLHPNHLHQIDPSLCLIYYTPKGQAIMRDEEFYKNKPASMDKVRLKVWRYVRYDHASGTIDVRYFEAAGENQHSLFEFLLYTWGQQSDRMSHGVPKMLLWDKGSANTSFAIKNLLDALGVDHETHATGHSWGKGGVEQGNNLVETHFESRLRFEPVESVEQLNASAARWVRDFNANAIEKVDCRLVRASGQPMVRDDLWQLIMRHPGALVQMPPREVCQWFMAGQELTRQVRNLKITFAHPELGRRASYDLNPWAEFLGNGQKVRVTPLLMQQGALRIEIDRLGAEPLLVQVEPEREFDEYGRPLSAPVAGEEYARAPQTASERAANTLAAAAWGDGTTVDEAEKKRAEQARPFGHLNDGKGLVAHSHLGQADLPRRLVPNAGEVQTPQVQQLQSKAASVQMMLTVPEAVRAIKERLGDAAPADLYSQVKAAFPDGNVPQSWADQWAITPAATGTHGSSVIELRRFR
ncbi:DDE-type integrase/transposase/recombinase [Aeromonas hydrophila]|uniref:DDE-type integrase/transposase/recombinase n=1 Tax=Aeromonas hydrophila TaxID=644 RepID=UPI001957A629|nr:DDE-type integrase/transposase/recombinase [Aeromonas hydrophila]